MTDPLSATVAILLKVGSIVGPAALSHLATKATDAGLKGLATAYGRLSRDRLQAGSTAVADPEQTQVAGEVEAQPQVAAELLNQVLTVDMDGDTLVHVELFLAGAFSLLSEIPPGIVAMPGSLCARESYTVVDVRGDDGRLQMPTQSEA